MTIFNNRNNDNNNNNECKNNNNNGRSVGCESQASELPYSQYLSNNIAEEAVTIDSSDSDDHFFQSIEHNYDAGVNEILLTTVIINNDMDTDDGNKNDKEPIILNVQNKEISIETPGGENEDGGTEKLPLPPNNIYDRIKLWKYTILKEKKRILVGFLIINLGFPLYLAYNNPSSMVKIFDQHYNINATQFGRLYSSYAIPNLFMVFLGGILIDLIGTNKCSLILSGILTLSTILAALSSTPANYGLLLFSRILLGTGGETLMVCMGVLITKYFEERNHSLLFGMEQFWLQIGSFLAFAILPSLFHKTNFATTLWFVAIIASTCTILNIIFILFQSKLVFNKDQTSTSAEISLLEEKVNHRTIDEDDLEDEFEVLQIGDNDDGASMRSSNSSNSGKHKKKPLNQKTSRSVILKNNLKQALQLVKTMPRRVWLISVVSFFGYSGFFGLDIIFTDMAIEKYGYSDTGAGFIMAIETLCTGLSSPIFGWIIRKLKRNILSMGIGITMMLIGMILIIVTPKSVNPTPFVALCGMGYIFMSLAIYSSIPKIIIDDTSQGTAYGIIATSYNIGIVIFPYILSSIRISTGSYYMSLWSLVITTFLALIFLIILKHFDKKELNELNRIDSKGYNFFFKFIN